MPESDATTLLTIALGLLSVLVIGAMIVLLRRRRERPAEPALPSRPEPIAFLERLGEGEGPRLYAINKPLLIIGRSADSDLCVIPEWQGALSVSRRHAQIRREDTDFVVEDLGSQNGIMVNGLVTHRNLLHDGYHITFGAIEFVFRQTAPGSGT